MTDIVEHIPGTKDYRDRLKKHATKVYQGRSLDSISKIAVHHSLTESGSAEAFARYHVTTKGWPGIGYHFVIEKDGTVKWCHNLTIKSYHVGNSNRFAVGICLVGDFRKQSLDEVQMQPLLKLIKYLLTELDLSYEDVWGHNQFDGYSWKECPCIDMETLRSALKNKSATLQPSTPVTDLNSLPNRRSTFNFNNFFNYNDFLTKPGESVLTAYQRFGLFDYGEIKRRNRTTDLKKAFSRPTFVKVKGPIEKVSNKTTQLIKAMERLGHVVFKSDAKPYNLNIIGVRNENSTPNKFDDEVNIIWKHENKWEHKTYKATTDPGLFYLQNPMRVDGTAILKKGQYRGAYKLGLHRQNYTALVQAKPVTVIRDNNRDNTLDFDSRVEQTGFFAIHIHHASYTGESTQVDKWSAGCQVLANIHEYNELIKLCKLGMAEWGDTITYTLINQRDLG